MCKSVALVWTFMTQSPPAVCISLTVSEISASNLITLMCAALGSQTSSHLPYWGTGLSRCQLLHDSTYGEEYRPLWRDLGNQDSAPCTFARNVADEIC